MLDIYYEKYHFVSRERLDPLLGLLTESTLVPQLVVLTLGCFFLLKLLGQKLLPAFTASIALTLSLVFVVGLDSYFLKIHWLPFLVVSALLFERRRGLLEFVLFLISTALWIVSAGSLASFGLLVGIVFLLAFSSRMPAIVLAVAVIPSVLFLPVYPMPDYPGGARLAEISPLITNFVQPKIGPWLEPNPLDYAQLVDTTREHLLRYAFLVLAVVLAFGLSKNLLPVIVGLLIVAIELALPAPFRAFSPLQSLRRLLPGAGLIDLPWIFSSVLILFSALPALIATSTKRVLAFAALIGLSFVGVTVITGSCLIEHGEVLKNPDQKQVLSAVVVEQTGEWVLAEKREFSDLVRIQPSESSPWMLESNLQQEALSLALDSNDETRWSTGRSQQPGDYFQVSFAEPTSVLRVVLSVKKHPTDFPRGIEVVVEDGVGKQVTTFSQIKWFGPVKWTRDGFPYFGPQSEVVIDFPRSVSARRIRFVQLGESVQFDWSIAELKLYASSSPSSLGSSQRSASSRSFFTQLCARQSSCLLHFPSQPKHVNEFQLSAAARLKQVL